MKTRFLRLASACALVITLVSSSPAFAQAKDNYAYIGVEPEIVTNYIGASARKLGYIRVTIELMINNVDQLEIAEHHMPLLRATAIEILGAQTGDKVKSLTGREEIRRAILTALQTLMKEETGSEVVKDVIFTKYLYQS
ncbi:flagellar basal body-associated protein FliL [Alteromonas pelagimontana]|uniref:Flagellar protein FliL n=1 Tax=Alteromonas pelagimontana TaxID=1858656 RepID=A0A6M4MEJ8_9ALTE|nr:flagellar basal body-associated protein FliL [Alteromonas pelagimontana]QJR81040.1 flagellar basal body-associated protein FliL [Alteromonas pelagimontana]